MDMSTLEVEYDERSKCLNENPLQLAQVAIHRGFSHVTWGVGTWVLGPQSVEPCLPTPGGAHRVGSCTRPLRSPSLPFPSPVRPQPFSMDSASVFLLQE